MPGNNVIDLTLETANDSLYVWMIVYGRDEHLYMGITILSEEFIDTDVNTEYLPDKFALFQGYPNPFNPITTINFSIPESGFVTLVIYNIMGQKVRELVDGNVQTGAHSVVWDGKDDSGETVSSGVYISRLKSGKNVTASRMLLMK